MSAIRNVLLTTVLGFMVVLVGCSSSGGADPAALEGTWVLEAFGGTTELVEADTTVTSELTLAAGAATGSGGVNSFSGTYEASDNGDLSFGPLASTQMAGPPEAMEQESAFFKALEATTRFEFDADKLVLTDMGNNTLAVLTPK